MDRETDKPEDLIVELKEGGTLTKVDGYSPLFIRPTNYELEQAIDIAEKMKLYIEKTEPYAKVNIERLQTAMDELSSHLLDDEED